jgi:hypothetical protein
MRKMPSDESGRDDVADHFKRAAKLIIDCAVRHGLTDKQIRNNDERAFRNFYGESWDQEVLPELEKIDENLFAFRDDFVSLMGRYFRKHRGKSEARAYQLQRR